MSDDQDSGSAERSQTTLAGSVPTDLDHRCDPSISNLTADEILRRTAHLTPPVIDPANPPLALRLYGDTEMDMSNAIPHVLYGLTRQRTRRRRPSGHKHGIMHAGQTWFPRRLSDQDVADLLGLILAEPSYYVPLRGISDRRVVLGHFDDVLYRLTWFPIAGRPVFRTCHPLGGPGVEVYVDPPVDGRNVLPQDIDWDLLITDGFAEVRS